MAAARPRVSGISGETAMTVDDVKNYLAGPDGPWVVLLALTVLFSIPRYPNRSLAALAPGAFAFVGCGETLRVYVDRAIRNYLASFLASGRLRKGCHRHKRPKSDTLDRGVLATCSLL